jgi:hypothetical protein
MTTKYFITGWAVDDTEFFDTFEEAKNSLDVFDVVIEQEGWDDRICNTYIGKIDNPPENVSDIDLKPYYTHRISGEGEYELVHGEPEFTWEWVEYTYREPRKGNAFSIGE